MQKITIQLSLIIMLGISLFASWTEVIYAQSKTVYSISTMPEPANPTQSPDVGKEGRLEIVARVGGAVMDVALQGDYAYLGKGTRLLVLDITKPENLQLIGSSADLEDIVQGVSIDGNIVYVADGGGGLRLFETSDPKNPKPLGFFNTWANQALPYKINEKPYIILADGDLRVIDVSNPAEPQEVGYFQTPGYTSALVVEGNLAYLADGKEGLRVIDLSNPAQPKEIGALRVPGFAYSITIFKDTKDDDKTYLFMANGEEGGLRVLLVNDPTKPVEVSSLTQDMNPRDLVLSGSLLLIANGEFGFRLLNITSPMKPVFLGGVDTPGYGLGIAKKENTAFLADGGGLLSFDFSDAMNPKQISSFEVLGAAYSAAISHQFIQGKERTYLYVADYYSGVYGMDISDPSVRPTITGFYDSPAYANHVILSSQSKPSADSLVPQKVYASVTGPISGLRIVDVTSPYYPNEVGSYLGSASADSLSSALWPSIFTNEQPNIKNTNSLREFAYIAEGESGNLRILDISNPQQPLEVSLYRTPGEAHHVVIRRLSDLFDPETNGESTNTEMTQDPNDNKKIYAFIAGGTAGLRILDVSDAQNPFETAVYNSPGTVEDITIVGKYAYLADGINGGVRIVNISNPLLPKEVGVFAMAGDAHSLTVSNEYLFLANGDQGLAILNVSDPTNISVTAQFIAPGYTNAVVVEGDMIYTANRGAGLIVYRLDKPNPLTLTVNQIDDAVDAVPGDGICATVKGGCSLRAAIQESNANVGLDTIFLSEGLYTLSLIGAEEEEAKRGDLDITDHLIIKGAGYAQTYIDGGGFSRVFHLIGSGRLWVKISDVTIQNGLGGGINVYQSAMFQLSNSQVIQNNGYGLWGVESKIFIDHCLFLENIDPLYVGGIGNHLGNLDVVNSAIAYNQGKDGGIYNDGNIMLVNTTISNNRGLNGSGGMNNNGKAKLLNVTIAENSGIAGGGLSIQDSGNLIIKNSIIINNKASQKSPDVSGRIISQGYNVIGDATGFIIERIEGDQIGVSATEINLAPLTKEQGLCLSHPLLPGSIAVQSKQPLGCLDFEGKPIVTDQCGRERPSVQSSDQIGSRSGDESSVCHLGARGTDLPISSTSKEKQ